MNSYSIFRIIAESSAFGIFILLVLVFMSLVSWAIIFNKWRLFKAVTGANTAFHTQFRKVRRLTEALGQAKAQSISPLAAMYLAGHDELAELYASRNEAEGLRQGSVPLTDEDFDIVGMTMERVATEEIGRMEKQVVFLATTGSSAPFMGLLGTVVGIMDSFWSIGERGSASLAVVAPGIAEALLATIVGLGAAIPAVIAYNWANNKMRAMNDRAEAFTLEFLTRARKEMR
jgi:biopolymer transport protein TolQ